MGMARPKRLTWGIAAGIGLALLASRPLLAADLSGVWTVTYRLDAETVETMTLDLVHDGRWTPGPDVVRGVGRSSRGRVEVRQGVARGTDVRLTLVDAGARDRFPTVLTGAWHRDEMGGRVDGWFGSRMFVASR